MARAATLTRLERLDWLVARLKAEDAMTLQSLAEELGVSARSLSRDIAVLRARGVPVEAEPGRGGGVRIGPTWGIGRIALTAREAIDLLVGLAVTERMDTPMLMAERATIQRKVTASFSASDQRKIRDLRTRIRVGPPSSARVLASFAAPKKAVVSDLQAAFVTMKTARLRYLDGAGQASDRQVEVHYLVLNHPIWYALAWDRLRNDVRTFRTDRIRTIELEEESFRLRPYADFAPAMEGNAVIEP